jgi:hypothetical protein
MSNRFHSKYHRQNHHTIPSPSNPDSSHDPIASYDNPFQGDFVLNGTLSSSGNLNIAGGITTYAGITAYGNNIINSLVTNTSTLNLNNNSPQPAFVVNQQGNQKIIAVTSNNTNPVFYVDTTNGYPANIGINTSSPQANLSVVGTVSSSSSIKSLSGIFNNISVNTPNSNVTATISGSVSASNTIYSNTVNTGNVIVNSALNSPLVSTNSLSSVTLNTNTLSALNLSAYNIKGNTISGNNVIANYLAANIATIGVTSVTANNDLDGLFVLGASKKSFYNQIQNIVATASASTDLTIMNDTGLNYLDIGINSSQYNGSLYYTGLPGTPYFTIVSPNDSYMYCPNNNLAIGTANNTSGDLILFTGGTASGTTAKGGNERFRITNSGNIGINTSSPNATLDIYGSARFGSSNSQVRPLTSNAGGVHANWNYTAGGGETDFWNLYPYGTGAFTFKGFNNSYLHTDLLSILNNGYVGIGTSNPTQQLTVVGSISSTGTVYSAGLNSTNLSVTSINNNSLSSNFITTSSISIVQSISTNGNSTPFVISASSNQSLYNQIQNFYSGVSASTDFVLTNDTGINYLGIGINSSQYNGNVYSPPFTVAGANDSYVYAITGNLALGSANNNTYIFAGGTQFSNITVAVSSNGYVGVGTSTPTTLLTVGGPIATKAPVTVNASTYTVLPTDSSLIFSYAGTCSVTLPAASSYSGRWLYLKLIVAQAVTSASSNVIPLIGGSASATLFSSNAAGKFTQLQSDGSNWQIMAQN